jgi:hypothetical protein
MVAIINYYINKVKSNKYDTVIESNSKGSFGTKKVSVQNTPLTRLLDCVMLKSIDRCANTTKQQKPIYAKISFRTFIVAKSTIGATAGWG